MNWAASIAAVLAAGVAGVRWLRVAQREHYLKRSVTTFAGRWWLGLGFNRLLAAAIIVNLVLGAFEPFFFLLGAVAIAVGPLGLRLRGTAPGPMRWTRRARTLAAVWATLSLALVGFGAILGAAPLAGYLVAVLTPVLVDIALAITEPLEDQLGQKWVAQAREKLAAANPMVLAITGSYGKTSTKGYAGHLIQGSRAVVVTPASFNNALGLARAINENLAPGTEVFVAEMGTYGPGEIASMVEWARPVAAAITAIGPVHLERMKTEDAIVEAKSEILATAETAILNVDDERLAGLAERVAGDGRRVLRCSASDRDADVAVIRDGDELVVYRQAVEIARFTDGDQPPGNVAIAVALAGIAGVPDETIARRIATLPTAPNRRTIETGSSGATYIDDTYNSNPAGAAAALATLKRRAKKANHVVLVTPGMVELGPRQSTENERLAAAASEICTDIVIIGSTNRRALAAGAHQGRSRVVFVDDRASAATWVRENTGPGDVVLFENDLPDHFP